MAGNEPITPSSVEEVLRELERLLPKHLDATALPLSGDLAIASPRTRLYVRLHLKCDHYDAEAKEILLDLLESLKYEPVVFPNFDELGDRVSGYRCDLWGVDWHTEHEGKTRSEAVARAVLAVLSQQEREGNTNV